MAEHERKHGFMDLITDGLSHISHLISESIFLPIAEGTEVMMNNVEKRIMRIGERMLKKIYTLIIIGLGGVFLILALFFYLIDNVGWSNTAAFFSIGIAVFVIGLVLKIVENGR